jgi:hypothetical protein
MIERLQRKRTWMTFFQAVFFVIWQSNFFSMETQMTPDRIAVDHVKVGFYIAWALILLAFIGTGGGWIWSREVRQVMNDEATLAHRRRGMAMGFWAAMLATMACYAVQLVQPIPTRVVLHIVLSAGIAVALITFGVLEWRAQRDG